MISWYTRYVADTTATLPERYNPHLQAFAGTVEPAGMVSLHYFVMLACVLICIGFVAARWAGATAFWQPFDVFRVVKGRLARQHQAYLFAYFFTLLLILAYLSLVTFARTWLRENPPHLLLQHEGLKLSEIFHRLFAALAFVPLVGLVLSQATRIVGPRRKSLQAWLDTRWSHLTWKDRRYWTDAALGTLVVIGTIAGALASLTQLVPWAWRSLLRLSGQENELHIGRHDLLWFYDRSSDLISGVSPHAAVLFIGLGLLSWSYFRTRRIRIAADYEDTFTIRKSDLGRVVGEDRARNLHDRAIRYVFRFPIWAAVAVMFVGAALLVYARLSPMFEGITLGATLFALACLFYFSIIGEWLRVHAIWFELRRFLDRLAAHPLRAAFGRVPAVQHDGVYASELVYAASVQEWRKLEPPAPAAPPWPPPNVEAAYARSENYRALSAQLLDHLIRDWATGGTPDPAAENFIALQVAYFVRHARNQMHNALIYVTSGVLVLLLVSNMYPFEYQKVMGVFCWIGAVLIIATSTYLLVEVSRHEMHSEIAKTEPGRSTLDRTLVGGLLTHAGLPVIGLFAAKVPVVGEWLKGVVEPLLAAFLK